MLDMQTRTDPRLDGRGDRGGGREGSSGGGTLKPPGKEDEPDENNFGDQFRSDPPATHSISDCKIMKNKRHFAVEKKTIPIGNFTSSIRYNFPTELPTYYCIT